MTYIFDDTEALLSNIRFSEDNQTSHHEMTAIYRILIDEDKESSFVPKNIMSTLSKLGFSKNIEYISELWVLLSFVHASKKNPHNSVNKSMTWDSYRKSMIRYLDTSKKVALKETLTASLIDALSDESIDAVFSKYAVLYAAIDKITEFIYGLKNDNSSASLISLYLEQRVMLSSTELSKIILSLHLISITQSLYSLRASVVKTVSNNYHHTIQDYSCKNILFLEQKLLHLYSAIQAMPNTHITDVLYNDSQSPRFGSDPLFSFLKKVNSYTHANYLVKHILWLVITTDVNKTFQEQKVVIDDYVESNKNNKKMSHIIEDITAYASRVKLSPISKSLCDVDTTIASVQNDYKVSSEKHEQFTRFSQDFLEST